MNRPATRMVFLFSVMALLAGLYSSCRKLDVPFVDDEDNIMLYLERSEDGHELFRTEGLYSDSPYTLVGDTAIYRLLIDSVRRSTELTVSPKDGPLRDYGVGNHILLRDAELVTDDLFYGRLLRIAGNDTTITPRVWGLTRKGLFLKLGADDRPFVGWKLWAYNGGLDAFSPPSLTFRRNDGSFFTYGPPGGSQFSYTLHDKNGVQTGSGSTEFKYRRLDNVPLFSKGERLEVASPIPLNSVEVLSNGRLSSGYDVQSIRRPDFDNYSDTLRTATVNTYYWNLFTFIERRVFYEQGFPVTTYINWCIPYRVAQ